MKNRLNNRDGTKIIICGSGHQKGKTFTSQNVRSIRPMLVYATKYFEQVLGQKANSSLKRTPMDWKYIEFEEIDMDKRLR